MKNRPPQPPKKLFIILFLSLIFFAGTLRAQDVEVYIEPDKCYIGGEIQISGFVKPNPRGDTYARLEFLKPRSQKIVTKRVKVSKQGEFDFLFNETDETGQWQLTVWKDGSRQHVKTNFTVSARIFMLPLVKDIDSLNRLEQESSQHLISQVENYPQFPGKADLLTKTRELSQKLDTLAGLYRSLNDAVKKMEDALEANASSIPPAAQAALRKAAATAARTSEKVQAEKSRAESLFEASKQAAQWCHEWKLSSDLFNHLNMITNFLSDNLGEIAVNLVVAKSTENLHFATSQTIGAVVTILGAVVSGASVIGILAYAAGTFTSLSKALFDELVKKFCTLYEGDVKGDYKTELLHRGAPFFTMTYKITGRMSLIFQNRKFGDPAVYLKGDFKGRARDFDCSITMVPFELPDTLVLAWCRSKVPPLGRGTVMLYLEGRALDDKMEVKMVKTAYDYKLEAKAYYVLLGAHHLIPIPGTLVFPLMKGEWFFTRVTKLSQPQVEYFELPIGVKGDRSKVEKEFTREIFLPATQRRKAVRVTMTFKIELTGK